jgi:hypothetical protein
MLKLAGGLVALVIGLLALLVLTFYGLLAAGALVVKQLDRLGKDELP